MIEINCLVPLYEYTVEIPEGIRSVIDIDMSVSSAPLSDDYVVLKTPAGEGNVEFLVKAKDLIQAIAAATHTNRSDPL